MYFQSDKFSILVSESIITINGSSDSLPSHSQTSVGKLKTSSKHTFFPITRRDHHPDDIVKPAVPVYYTVRSPSTLVYIFLSDIVLLTRLINTVKETSKDRHTTMDYVMRTPITSLEYRTMYIYFPI